MRIIRYLALLSAGLSIFTAAAQAQQGVCVYRDSNYEGPRRCFENSVHSFDKLGINDQISSFRIHGNVEVIFYERGGFKGANKRFTHGLAVLGDGMNDNFSSMKIVKSRRDSQWGNRGSWGKAGAPHPYNDWNDDDRDEDPHHARQARVCLYADRNFRGKEVCFNENNPRFENLGFDNKADSMRIEGDIVVQLFQHAGYKGFSRTYRNSVARFSAEEKDQYSAIRIKRGAASAAYPTPVPQSPPKTPDFPAADSPGSPQPGPTPYPGQVCLFPDKNYGGQPYCFTGDNARFADIGFDNKADSIIIDGGMEAVLYQHENYTGYSRVFRESVANFKGKDHDQYSSIRIRRR